MEDVIEKVKDAVIEKVVDVFFSAAPRQLDYVLNYTKNVDELKNEAKNLKELRGRIRKRSDVARENGEALLDGVQNWMKDADSEISEVDEFLEKEKHAKKTCFGLRPFVNPITLYHYGKMAKNKTSSLQKHQEDGKTHESCVSIPTPTPRLVDLYQTKNLDDIDSHKSVLGEIIEAIKDDSIQMVGIYGLGGVGKTTLAKEVVAQVKNLFAHTEFITVSRTINVKEIQKQC